ncbi:MAG: ion transporter [Bacteroidota bacterium]
MIRRLFLSEKKILWAIVANAVVIFLLYFPQLKQGSPTFFSFLDFVDHVFVVFFIVEALVKIAHYRAQRYFSDGWNIFDFVIAVASIPSLLHYLGFPLLPNTSLLKILRLLRLARIIRFMRFVPHMDMLVSGLKRAIKASVFLFLALLIANFILALFTCHFFGQLVPEYFGDPLVSSYHIFQMFTIEGWNEIPSEIALAVERQGSPYGSWIIGFARLYSAIIVLVGGILGMSLANAVFVDEMTIDNNQDLERKIDDLQQQIAELKSLLENKA